MTNLKLRGIVEKRGLINKVKEHRTAFKRSSYEYYAKCYSVIFTVSDEEAQDMVENQIGQRQKQLMTNGVFELAKRYITSRYKRSNDISCSRRDNVYTFCCGEAKAVFIENDIFGKDD